MDHNVVADLFEVVAVAGVLQIGPVVDLGVVEVDPVRANREVDDGVVFAGVLVIEDEDIFATAAGQDVVAIASIDQVVAGSAIKIVCAVVAEDPVGARGADYTLDVGEFILGLLGMPQVFRTPVCLDPPRRRGRWRRGRGPEL